MRTSFVGFVLSLMLCASAAFAQNARSSVQGRVTHASGAVLQGASVTFSRAAKMPSAETKGSLQ